MSAVIKAENISKQYRLGQVGTGSLKDDFKRWRYQIMGKEDPFLKIGEENERTKKTNSDYVWALKDITFEVNKGDVLGIIGKNGAGKSTLLKILSRTTGPTTGSLKMKGRVASLLEVGTGFHGELSGRENIYLNGAIMGMGKAEIRKKFDEIVDFAGVEKYIDTPVKRYSSGMYVRLAFGVAAHLEPDIMIIDEVLAVGDAEFQKKAIGKMKDVSSEQGRTVLFVSHNMAAIQSLCTKALLLKNGTLNCYGNVHDMVSLYLNSNTDNKCFKEWSSGCYPGGNSIEIISVSAQDSTAKIKGNFYLNEEAFIRIRYRAKTNGIMINYSISVYGNGEEYVLSSPSINDPNYRLPLNEGIYETTCILPANLFNEGDYHISVLLVSNRDQIICQLDKIISISYNDNGKNRGNYFGRWNGIVRPNLAWNTKKYVI